MILPINDQYRIASDSRQWMIQASRMKNGESVWEPKLYFGTIESAVKELGELMVRTSGAQTLVDALADVEKVTTTLSQALTPHSELILEAMAKELDD